MVPSVCRTYVVVALLALGVVPTKFATAASDDECLQVETQPDFDLTAYVQGRWFVQQQMATEHLPATWNWCTTARYTQLESSTFWGYTVQVNNYAQEEDGTVHSSGNFLCAVADSNANDPAKLLVGPCMLPNFPGTTTGSYWVLAYDESEGYALISGGQPTIKTADGCKTESGTNGAGLWIFTRQQARDEQLVSKVRNIAQAQGFDLTVLQDVAQENCPQTFPSGRESWTS